MPGQAIPIIDVSIIVIISVSFLFGIVRGATKEILSIVSWIGGIFFTISVFPYAKSFMRQYISHGLIADFVTICILFIFFLTILSTLNYICSKFIKESVFNNADRALGGILGIIRGIVIVAIANIALSNFISSEEIPNYISNSKLRPYITNISNSIILILPDSIQDDILTYMNKVSKDSIIDFVSQEPATSEITDNSKITASPEESSANQAQSQDAKDLATLRPKIANNNDKKKNVKKSGKEKLDMERLLDDV